MNSITDPNCGLPELSEVEAVNLNLGSHMITIKQKPPRLLTGRLLGLRHAAGG
jgi:hypothetical protein